MKLTFSDHFSVIRNQISPGLLNTRWAGQLMELCTQFPFDTSTNFGFESRLGNPEASCDFFLLISKSSHGAKMIAGESQVAGLSPGLQMHPFWQRLSALFREWNSAGSFLNRHVSSFWLEFDFNNGAYEHAPNLFFRFSDDTGLKSCLNWNDLLETTLDNIYSLLFGSGFPADLASEMRRCLEALPPGAILYQTGFMIPRKNEAIKLVLSRINPDELPGYLIKTGWPGDIDEMMNIENRYRSHFVHAFYDLTIGKTILPHLGIELFFQYGSQPQWDSRWRQALDMLQNDNLLSNEKKEGLVNFCGKKSITHLFPVTYYNGINHLKLVCRPKKKPECKGYFGTMIVSKEYSGKNHD